MFAPLPCMYASLCVRAGSLSNYLATMTTCVSSLLDFAVPIRHHLAISIILFLFMAALATL